MKFIFASFILCWALIGPMYSQTDCCPYIDSIKIIPPNPTTNNSVRIVTKTTTPSLGTKLSFKVTKQADTFNLVGCFWPGIATAPRTFLDTVTIGTLTAGTYYVYYIGQSSSSPSLCTVVDSNLMTTSFQVVQANGIESSIDKNNHFFISPNPTKNLLSIKFDETVRSGQLELINCLGQVCLSISLTQEVIIDMTAFAAGVYIISFANENNMFFDKVIKQ